MTADTYAVLIWMKDNLAESVACAVGRVGEKYVLTEHIRQMFAEQFAAQRGEIKTSEEGLIVDLSNSVVGNVNWDEVTGHVAGAIAVDFNEDEWEQRLRGEATTHQLSEVDYHQWVNRETWALYEWLSKTNEWGDEITDNAKKATVLAHLPQYIERFTRNIVTAGLRQFGPVYKPIVEVALQRAHWPALANYFGPPMPKTESARDIAKHLYSKGGE